jgi:hypothetical protein
LQFELFGSRKYSSTRLLFELVDFPEGCLETAVIVSYNIFKSEGQETAWRADFCLISSTFLLVESDLSRLSTRTGFPNDQGPHNAFNDNLDR